MKVKFLQTTPSDNPDLPFQAGQIIDVPTLSHALTRCLEMGAAVALPEEPEMAVQAAAPERATLPRPKGKHT